MLPCSLVQIKYVILRQYLTMVPAYELSRAFTVALYNIWDNGTLSLPPSKSNTSYKLSLQVSIHMDPSISCNVTSANDWSNSKFTNYKDDADDYPIFIYPSTFNLP